MTLVNPLYSEIEDRVTSWLQYATSETDISDRPKDCINRAKEWLEMQEPWEDLLEFYTLSITNRQGSLPSDYYRPIWIYEDSIGYGKPTRFYYRWGREGEGYKIENSFTKASGHSRVITFFEEPTGSVYLIYQKALEAFAGSETEYSFFPAELIFKAVQYLWIADSGVEGREFDRIEKQLKELLEEYKKAQQNVNNKLSRWVNDIAGNTIQNTGYNLRGNAQRGYTYSPYPNSFHGGR